jgi:cytochrome c biogenesis protein CcmG, thiol:disulfide interchange protein DsbE
MHPDPVPLLRVIVVALVVVLLAGGCGDSTPQLQSGAPTPAFRLASLAGDEVAFPAQTNGQVVAIRFWADWCPFCASEMTQLEPLYRRYRDQGLRILAINVRQDADTARRFVAKVGISYEALLDSDGRVARSYGVLGLPTTFFVDRSGRLRGKVVGESTPEVFERMLREML